MKTLAKEIPFLSADFDSGVFTPVNNQGYRQQGPVFIYSTYFDLMGMAIDDKTLFFEGATVQDVSIPISSAGSTAGDSVVITDLMTTKPLTDTEAATYSSIGNFAAAGGVLTFDQTTYARVRHYNIDLDNAAANLYIKLGDHQTGSLDATASDRIYCYRVIIFLQVANPCLTSIPSARYILRANPKEEPEFEYLMRLKRSYELQNAPDRD